MMLEQNVKKDFEQIVLLIEAVYQLLISILMKHNENLEVNL